MATHALRSEQSKHTTSPLDLHVPGHRPISILAVTQESQGLPCRLCHFSHREEVRDKVAGCQLEASFSKAVDKHPARARARTLSYQQRMLSWPHRQLELEQSSIHVQCWGRRQAVSSTPGAALAPWLPVLSAPSCYPFSRVCVLGS